MSNINVRVVATANVTQMESSFGRLQAQAAALNAQLEQMIALSKGVDPIGYERMASAAQQNSKLFRNAAASTGAFEVQQLKLNRATDDYIKSLKNRKLGFMDMIKQHKVATQAYREQLAMEKMLVRQSQIGSMHGKQMLDVVYPKVISKDLDTAGRRMAWFNEQLKSGAHQMVNWGKNTQWAGRQLMVGLTLPVAAFGAAAGVMAYQVDKELTRIAKVYDTNADMFSSNEAEVQAAIKETEMVRKQATQTAIDSAKKYGAAGKDTLSVQAELAATGLQGAELQEYTNEVMRIATLGELEYADATNTAIAAQSTFKLNSAELSDTLNYMNAVENSTSLQTKDFAQAIPVAAGVMKAWGGDIKELGVLLTAMRENGIGAAEGANAIKATLQRLARPSKQIREEWAALTGTDITKLVDNADSLTEVFQKINIATKDLDPDEQRKAFAGLFGSYQVSRMMAMTKGMNDLAAGTGQVSKAAELATTDVETLANIAEKELAQQAESVSGKWTRAFETLKLQLATLGEPFLEVATFVVNQISKIIDAFNSLPDISKKFIAVLVAAGALAGPVIMLVGLFANLLGNTLKMGAAFTGLFVKMNILDKESRAAALASELAAAGFTTEASAAELLRKELEMLIAAKRAAHTLTFQGMTAAERKTYYQQTAGPNTLMSMKYAEKYPAGNYKKNADLDQAYAINRMIDQENKDIAKSTEKSAKNTKAMGANMKLAAVSSGLFAAGMVASVIPGNETANNIGNMAILASLVLPAAQMLAPAFAKAAVAAKGFAVALGAGSLAMVRTTAGAAAALGPINAVKAGGAAFASSMAGVVNPIGLAAVGLAAGAFAMYKLHQSAEQERQEQELALKTQQKAQANILDLTKKWADETGRAYKNYVAYNQEGEKNYTNRQQMAYQEKVKFFEDDTTTVTSGDKTKEVKTIDQFTAGTAASQAFTLQNMARQAITDMGMTLVEGKQMLTAFLDAAGYSFDEAQLKAGMAFKNIGDNIKDVDWDALITQGFAAIKDAAGNRELGEQVGQELGTTIGIALDKAKGVNARKKVLDTLQRNIMTEWGGLRNNLSNFFESKGGVFEAIEDSIPNASITFKQKLAKTFEDIMKDPDTFRTSVLSGEFFDLINKNFGQLRGTEMGDFLNSFIASTGDVETAERSIVKSFGNIFGLADGVDTLKDALNETRVELMLMGEAARTNALLKKGGVLQSTIAAVEEINRLQHQETPGLFGGILDASQNKAAQDNLNKQFTDLKMYLESGIDVSKIDKDMISFLKQLDKLYNTDFMSIIRGLRETGKAADDAAGKRKLEFDVTIDDAAGAMRDAMTGVQQDIADTISEDFDRQMNAAIDSRQEMWDRRAEALSADLERRGRQLDAKWERRKTAAESYWDRRTEGVEKAIEAEQKAEDRRVKMFDAEIARIQKLNDMMNKNIDFNLALSEGRFDEAAKIRNDAQADAEVTALERARDRGTGKSEKRIDSLEGRQEAIDKAREQQMKALDKREDAERRHLEKVGKMREKALERQTENDMEAVKEQWDFRKKSLDEQTDLFLSYIAKNEKDLRRHTKNVGGAYRDFGNGTLKPMGEDWSTFFEERLTKHIRKAGLEIRSDKMWEELGKSSVRDMLRGMGFAGMGAFRRFIKTGEIPANFGKPLKKPTTGERAPKPGERHTGGWVNDNPGSRKGVARTLGGLHSSEQMIRAQRGEYVVNRKSASDNAALLDAINSGRYPKKNGVMGGGGFGTGPGPAGLLSGITNKMFGIGVNKSLKGAINKKVAAARASMLGVGALYGVGDAGMYSDRAFSTQQLKNAAIIASVGSSMGMSQRDLMIGIMTAITESGLVNVQYGDRDSLGLFQQRPSMGWGTAEQVTDPQYAARKFFSTLKGVGNHDEMLPWLAAQAVQRSAYSDGSNYRQYWDNAQAIFKNGIVKLKSGGYDVTSGPLNQGPGGHHRPINYPVSSGLHDTSTAYPGIDFSTGGTTGHPVYAVANAKVGRSYDIPGYEPRAPHGGLGYKSYGRVITLNLDQGGSVLYAHLSSRGVAAGTRVKGGTVIGKSGNTGYSTGPHLHFGASNGNPYAYLKQGGTVKYDGTPAVLHKNERVLTAPLTNKLDKGIDYIFEAADKARKNHKNKGGKKSSSYTMPSGPMGLGSANGPYEWFATEIMREASKRGKTGRGTKGKGDFNNLDVDQINDSGKRSTVRMGTLNTYVGTSARATMADLTRLMPLADVLSLTEVKSKFNALKGFLGKHGWGLHGGKSRDARGSVLAWNQKKYQMMETGTRKLGNKQADILGGRELRYANYGLLKDRKTGRQFWQVSAHTVPTPGFDERHRRLFFEQWHNIDKLVGELKASGAPVFLSGDLNERRERPWFRTPEGLGGAQGLSVDWMFHDKRLAKFLGKKVIRGMHTDHAGALLGQYNIPGLAKGGNIRWDNTLANLHKGETVLTADLSRQLRDGIGNLANGSNDVYNINVAVANPTASTDEIANKVVTKLERDKKRKPGSRRG